MEAVAVIESTDKAAAALQPLRLSLLERLAQPASASALARDLGMTRQKLYYHLNALLKAGLVERVEERRKGNCIEVIMRAKARAFVVGPSALREVGADPQKVQDRFSWSYLVALCAKAIAQLAILRRGADAEGKQLATLAIESEVRFASAKARSAFANEIATSFAQIASKYHAPDAKEGRTFRVFACAHPQLPASETDANEDPK